MDTKQNERSFISIDDLVERHVYLVEARAFQSRMRHGKPVQFGIWNSKKRVFVGLRSEFGDVVPAEELEYSTSDHFGTARATMDTEIIVPSEIVIETYTIDFNKDGKEVSKRNNKLALFLLSLGERVPEKYNRY